MKNLKHFFLVLIVLLNVQFTNGQDLGLQGYALLGKNHQTIELKQTFTKTSELFRFDGKVSTIFGLAIKADITFNDEKSLVQIILVDQLNEEYLVYETYPLLETQSSFSIDNLCEETAILEAIMPQYLRIEVTNAIVSVKSITYATEIDKGLDIKKIQKDKKNLRNNRKIQQINKSIATKGLSWIAGNTRVCELTYAEKKKLFGQSTFPSGFEFYVGGVIQAGDRVSLKSATASTMVEQWDWRNRHGKNWITSVKDQGNCGSCWAFAVTGATEAMVNVYFNQILNPDLSEQDILSCSGAGDCTGGNPGNALNYIMNAGIVDENCFLYSTTALSCNNKSNNPSDLFKIGGKIDFGTTLYPKNEDVLKRMLIETGPISGGLYDWRHAMVLAGYKVVKEGDKFCYRGLDLKLSYKTVYPGDPLIGKTVWIFKNSWGTNFGDEGYVYVETPMSNFEWTHSIKTPIIGVVNNYQVICEDRDADGYYWWGLGPKPANCPPCPASPDGDDSDATRGPIDANGNFISLTAPPVADFASDKTIVTAGESVNFTDISTGNPNSWSWTFEGGTPAGSTAANPVVAYNTPGKYDVTLVVRNPNGSDTKIKIDQITVNPKIADPIIPTYCSSKGSASKEWITGVSLNGSSYPSGSSGSSGYENFTAKVFNVNNNSNYTLNLTPKYSGKANPSSWSVWIDFNHDFDFNDSGEQILVASNTKTAISKNISIPSGSLTGPTRMRVSMKRSALPLPCEIFAYGEVEDYTINISAALSGEPSVKNAEIGNPEIARAINLKLYPNPVSRTINLVVDEVFEQDEYSIFNVQGVLINKKPLNYMHTQVDVSSFPAGLYLIKVTNGTRIFQEKFIKEK